MEIQYLNKLADNKQIGGVEIRGVTETRIQEVEQELGIQFPKAYREFLFLAGDFHGILQLLPGATDLEGLADKEYLAIQKKNLSESEAKIEGKFWIFTEMDGFQQFFFFYLEAGVEDPIVYQGHDMAQPEYSKITSTERTLSEFINGVVEQSILYAKRGY